MPVNNEQITYLSEKAIKTYFSQVNKHSGAIYPGEDESPQLYKAFGCINERDAKGSIICNENCPKCRKPASNLAKINDIADDEGFRLVKSNNGRTALFASIEGFHPTVDFRINGGPGNSHRRIELLSSPAVTLPRIR